MLGLKIETVRGLNHCEQIFTVPGIGWAEMGPGDMHMSMGLIRDGHDHEEVEKARKRVNTACEKNGVKFLGGVHGGDDKVGALKKVIDNGARIISGDDETAPETVLKGGDGVISVAANAIPKKKNPLISKFDQNL